MIVLPGGRSATASSISPSCSSSVSVEASPVVPATTNPSEPFSARWCISATNASSLTFPATSKGVTIAVRIVPNSVMGCSIPRAPFSEQQALQPDDEPLLEASHAADGEQNPRHKRLPADRVVANRESLPDVAEYDLLVGNEPRQAHRVDRW